MIYKAIFIDVDGVLVDSEKIFNECWRRAANQSGYVMTFEQALLLRSLDSQLAKELFVSWYASEDVYPVIRSARKEIMAEYVASKPPVAKKGVQELLKSLSGLPVKVVIVTSSPVNRITNYLSSANIDVSLFDDVITTEKVTRGKPFPDVYEYACRTLGFKANECIAVEDSPNGVKSAHQAGCYTVMIPDLSPYTEDLKQYVDVCFSNLSDLLTLFGGYEEK